MGWLCILPIVAVASQALNSDNGHFVDELILGNNKNPVARGLTKYHIWERSNQCVSMSESDIITFDPFQSSIIICPSDPDILGTFTRLWSIFLTVQPYWLNG